MAKKECDIAIPMKSLNGAASIQENELGEWSGDWYQDSCILVFGDTGTGKSTLLNLFTGNQAHTGRLPNGTTDENRIYEDKIHEKYPKWMDTIGLNDAKNEMDKSELYQSYLRMLKDNNVNSVHAVIWTMLPDMKYKYEHRRQALYIQALFDTIDDQGNRSRINVWKNVILLCKGIFDEEDFQGAKSAITDILGDNAVTSNNIECINMEAFAKIDKTRLDFNCQQAISTKNRLNEVLGNMKTPLYLNFKPMICLDCGQKGDPRLMEYWCHLEKEKLK